jgi:RND family efflux transporter MFP subunit
VLAIFAGPAIGLALSIAPVGLTPAFAQQEKPETRTGKKPAGQEGGARRGGENAGQGSGEQRRGRGRRGGRGGAATVEVDAVIKAVGVETIPIYGRVVADQTGVVAARTRGAVESVNVRIGDRVKKGDVLATLVTATLEAEKALKEAELKEYNASIRTVGAQLSLTSQELERLEKLRRSAAFSVARYQDKLREVERFRSSIAEARAKVDQAKAELRLADINLYNSKILAQFDGVVTQRHVEAGNFVNLGAPVVSMINDSSLEVEGEVPSHRLGGMLPGAEIEVIPEHGKPFKAAVRAVVPEENALARTRLVRFTPKIEGREDIAANQSVILHIPSSKPREVVSVHKDAITQRRGKRVVFVFDPEEKRVRMREVELGEAFSSRFEVLKGLTVGDRVVIRGNERLRPNQQASLAGEARRGGRRGGGGGEGRRRRGGDDEGGEGRRRRGGDGDGNRPNSRAGGGDQ